MILAVIFPAGGVLGRSVMLDVPYVLLCSPRTCGLASGKNSALKLE